MFAVARPISSRRTKKLSTYSIAAAICSEVAVPCVTPVQQVQQQRVDGRGAPGVQPLQPPPHLRVRLLVGVEDDPQQRAEPAEAGDLGLDLVLGVAAGPAAPAGRRRCRSA